MSGFFIFKIRYVFDGIMRTEAVIARTHKEAEEYLKELKDKLNDEITDYTYERLPWRVVMRPLKGRTQEKEAGGT